MAPTVRRYRWGDGAALARWIGAAPDDAAEAWFGDVDGRLPYLVKVLAARRPLSVQVHPAAAEARSGRHADPHAKPELLLALEPVHVLAGFRTPAALAEALHDAPELAQVLPNPQRPWDVRGLLEAWLALSDAAVVEANRAWLARIRARGPATATDRWALATADDLDRGDRGSLMLVALAPHVLAPGEALFVPTGVAHALLSGVCLEVAGPSDNVVRLGLTAKPVDSGAFLRVVEVDAAPVRVPAVGVVPVPTAQFAVTVHCRPATVRPGQGPHLVVNVGAAPVRVGADGMVLAPGQACEAAGGPIVGEGALRVVQVSPGGRLGAVLANVHAAVASHDRPGLVGVVAGSAAAAEGWRTRLGPNPLGARHGVALCEDLPVNQAFGVLLAWQRIRPRLHPGEGALVAFAFGDGTRAAPFTQAEGGQKPALASFVAEGPAGARRWLTTAELALRQFAVVEAHLRRSGFDGLVVKWGDEVLVPSVDLSGRDPRLGQADVVRFVSRRAVTDADAISKDWVATDAEGRVTAFVPRRGRAELVAALGGELGCVNLGSIAVSRALLDGLTAAFGAEIADPHADRRDRPDLDPQLFTALVVAAEPDPDRRLAAWRRACAESPAIARVDAAMPALVPRLRAVFDRLAERGRPVSIVALDLGEPYWGDLGEQRRIREFFLSLGADSDAGHVARALAGVTAPPDADGNRLVGDCRLGPGVRVRGSVLIDAWIDEGTVLDSVLVGTRARCLVAERAFDVLSVADDLWLGRGAGAYRLATTQPAQAAAGERLITWVGPEGPVLLRGHEDLDLRDPRVYDTPVLGNPVSFRAACAVVPNPGAPREATPPGVSG